MRLSRNKINEAGRKLLSSKSIEERNAALDLINEWRFNHLQPLVAVKNALLKILDKNKITPVLVSQRLKRMSSIEYKLDLNENMGLGGMQDIGGFRTVVKDTKDLYKLQEILERNSGRHERKKVSDYVANPKDSGYRSIHYRYIYKSRIERYNGIRLELQIRTKLQHNWATAVETAGIFTKTSLKSSKGSDEWLDFFKVVSSLFAIKEEQPVLEAHSELTMEDLMKKCHHLTKRINVIDILKGLRISAKQIEIEKYKGEYYLIHIDFKLKHVHVYVYRKSQFEEASAEYLGIEKTVNENQNAVVLVSASSIKSLQKAYPSYFLDTSEFISALEKINANCEALGLV
jgi:putative GTP pyrophosphokinase